ncbi:MAG: cyclic nucleotide-binding domain-containing protein [Myxococcaceae bacterium]|nr:cyclic nucleotide-binding domain-containing protein [Myxococcaceae bacterium]
MTPGERAAHLGACSFFQGLAADELAALASVVTVRSIDKGTALFRAGDPADGLFVLVRGTVAIRDGGTTLSRVAPPECFGELGALAEEPRSADAICERSCEVLRLSTRDLHSALRTRPALQRQVMLGLVRKVREVGSRARQ